MAISLLTETRAAVTTKSGQAIVVLMDNQKIRIKAPMSEILLDEGPEDSKVWTVTVNVYIVETDA
jgi:hypothetical protein